MNNPSISVIRARGEAIVDRLAREKLPPTLKPFAKAFAAVHREFEAAAAKADALHVAYTAALETVGQADTALDEHIDLIADRVAGAGIAKRTAPFAGFSAHTPTDLKRLPYSTEVKEVRLLIAKVTRKKPKADVARALRDTSKRADQLEKSLRSLTAPHAAYQKAMITRDALYPNWERALRKLKIHAAAVWDDAPDKLKTVFADATAIQAPVKHRASKKKPATAPAPAT